jgi:hypothetical protein
MTQEEKRLLLVDLCSRIPYGVKVNINSPIEEQNRMELFDVNLESETIGVGNEKWMFRAVPMENEDGWVVKPYLRSMESMTDEEIDRMWEIYESGPAAESSVAVVEYLYERHLDCHHLIEQGLADEALDGMYDKEEGSLE